jgi:hypothetical protein
MRYLFGAAILTASLIIAASADAQTRPPAAPDQVIALDGSAWSKPYPALLARQRPRRYLRRVHRRAGLQDFYDLRHRYPAQHELPPIFYGSRFGF